MFFCLFAIFGSAAFLDRPKRHSPGTPLFSYSAPNGTRRAPPFTPIPRGMCLPVFLHLTFSRTISFFCLSVARSVEAAHFSFFLVCVRTYMHLPVHSISTLDMPTMHFICVDSSASPLPPPL